MGANVARNETGVRHYVWIGFSRFSVQLSFVKRIRTKMFSHCRNFVEKNNADLGIRDSKTVVDKNILAF